MLGSSCGEPITLWFKVIWGYFEKVVLHRKGIKDGGSIFWPLHYASITEAQLNLSSEARLHLPQRGGWWESSLAGADKLQACTIYSRELAIPFTLHYLQTGQNHR
jgi:hypothetical protein